MSLESIGYYALPVIPSFDGMDRQVNAGMRKSFGGFGKKLGIDLGQGIGQGLKATASATASAAKTHTDALDKVKDATGKLRAEEAKLATARSNAASKASAVGTAERRLKELRDGNKATAKQLESAERSVRVAREQARNAGSQTVAIEQRVEATRRREAATTRDAKRAEDELNRARRAGSAPGSMINPLANAERGMQGSSGGMSSLAGGIGGKVGGAFMGALGAVVSVAAVAALFKSALDTGIDFERTVNAFSGVTDSDAAGMEKMRQAARALGTDTKLAGVSASDAGRAMLELAKGGMTAQQSMDAARGTLQLATAGQIDAAEAAKYQSAAINTFSLKATDAMHVADLLAAAANASSADVSDLGMALQQGGSVAAGFGVSIEDTLTALTMFSRMGINGSDAGTMLKTSLQSITDQGKPAQGAIDELGLSLYDATGKFVGVESMMKQVSEASTRMSEEQFQAATNVLFGSDAMRASMVAAQGGAKAWDEAATAVNRQGAAADMAAAQMQGLPGVVESLSNVWEGFKLKLFDVLDGPLIAIGNWFLNTLNGDGPTWLKSIGDTFMQVGDAAKQYLLPALTELWQNIKGPLIEYGTQWIATFKEAWPIIKVVAGVIGVGLLNAVKTLSVALPIAIKGLTGVISVAQAVYAGIKSGVSIVMEVAGVIRDVFVGAWDLLKGAISAAWSAISPVFAAIGSGFSALGEAGRYVFDTVLVPMWHNLQTAASGAWSLIQPVFGFLGSAWDTVASAATAFWQGAIVPVWEGVKTAFSAGWGAISPIFEMIKGAFKGVADFVSGAWSGLAGVVKSAFDGVMGAVKGPLRWLGGILQKVPLKIGPIEIPGAQMARDLGSTLAGLRDGGTAGRTKSGRLFGPGTGTSDSILGVDTKGRPTALVSAGEGVVTANAMSKGGAPMVAALNAGWVPSAALLHSMLPGFAGGGQLGDAGGLLPFTQQLRAAVLQAFPQVTDIGGYRGPDGYNEHSSGRALDVMVPNWQSPDGVALGNQIVQWALSIPGVNRVMWQQSLIRPGGQVEPVPDRGSPTANHMDHVHIFTDEMPAGSVPAAGLASAMGSTASGLSGSMNNTVPTGSTAGTNERGESGYYTPDQSKIAEKEALLAEREARVREVEAKADASESEKLRAERLRDEAKADLDEVRRGKFTKFKEGEAGAAGEGGDSQLGELGSIGKQFLSDTFGFGDLLPDPSQLGIVKLASALMGIKYTPQGKGFPWQSGYANGDGTPWSGTPVNPFGGLVDAASGGGGQLPLGMIPGISSVLPNLSVPTSAHGDTGGAPPGPVDQSTHLTIQNPQMTEESNANLIRRTLIKTPRLGTYQQNPGVMGS
ncbi:MULTISPECIES: phage tail tape measure protein [unclassified Mycobacterium]|uniref:phage tail tape measure protein n=1 Tax=unclassified Mycobacterium TaxID=2642494 RepID=UPI0029C6A30A|nr:MULTISPECIES: phage tail tape measure protein [unclassified Mycobacterium]